MGEVGFVNKEKNPERRFSPRTDLSPLEHNLIGSSLPLEDGRVFNTDLLLNDRDIAQNPDFLLKPWGLRTKESSIEEITRNREGKRELIGWFACFRVLRDISDRYEFGFYLGTPDDDGLVPNKFQFRFRKLEGESGLDLAPEQKKDVDAFEAIKLTPSKAQVFSLTKDPNTRILTLTYKPLLKDSKQ